MFDCRRKYARNMASTNKIKSNDLFPRSGNRTCQRSNPVVGQETVEQDGSKYVPPHKRRPVSEYRGNQQHDCGRKNQQQNEYLHAVSNGNTYVPPHMRGAVSDYRGNAKYGSERDASQQRDTCKYVPPQKRAFGTEYRGIPQRSGERADPQQTDLKMNEICRLVKQNKLTFPYKRHFLNLEDLKSNFKLLQVYRFDTASTPYTILRLPNLSAEELMFHYDHDEPCYLLLTCKEDDYFKFQIITDYFQEEARMQAKRYDAECSPYEYWLKYPEDIFNRARNRSKRFDQRRDNYICNSNGLHDISAVELQPLNIPDALLNLTPYELRESIHEITPHIEATQFRPTLMVEFVKKFNRRRVLDICAGWGDRLIGAMAAEVEFYCGVDPSTILHENYQTIKNTFLPLLQGKPPKEVFDCGTTAMPRFYMMQEPFQTADVPNAEYDLIFTSPPYFDLEIYCDEETQSHKLGSLENWYSDFLIFSLQKAWRLLCNEGLCCIVLNDIEGKPSFTRRMVADVSKFDGAKYKGVIGYLASGKAHPQPIWIWKKELPSST